MPASEEFSYADLKQFSEELVHGLTNEKLIKKSFVMIPRDADLSADSPVSGKYTLRAGSFKSQGHLVFRFGIEYADHSVYLKITTDHAVVDGQVKMAPSAYTVSGHGTNTVDGGVEETLVAPENMERFLATLGAKYPAKLERLVHLLDACELELSAEISQGKVIPLNFEIADKGVNQLSVQLLNKLTAGGELHPDAKGSYPDAQVTVGVRFDDAGKLEISTTCFDEFHSATVTQVSTHSVINGVPNLIRTKYTLRFMAENGVDIIGEQVSAANNTVPAYVYLYPRYPKTHLRAATIADQVMWRIEKGLKKAFES